MTDKAEIAPPYFTDDMHALHVGFLAGALVQAGFMLILEHDDDGNYTGEIEISLPSWEEDAEPIRVVIRVMS